MGKLTDLHLRFLREASQEKPLDDVAFADHRDSVPAEPDNALEKELYRSLKDFLSTRNLPIPAKHVAVLKKILDSGSYTDVFHPPAPGSKIYRGMVVDRSYLLKALKKKFDDVLEKTGELEEGFTFTPYATRKASSWTLEPEVSKEFSWKVADGEEYGLELESVVGDGRNNHLIACPGGLYDVNGLGYIKSEEEVIVLGAIKVQKLKWRILSTRGMYTQPTITSSGFLVGDTNNGRR